MAQKIHLPELEALSKVFQVSSTMLVTHTTQRRAWPQA